MLRASPRLLNFFPMGFSSGPKNVQDLRPDVDPHAVNTCLAAVQGKPRQGFVDRRCDLELRCEHCRFLWRYDTLTVWCPAHPGLHNQREVWLQPTWMYNKQQPFQYWKYLTVSRNPRTGMIMGREDAKSMNNERRAAGLTTQTRNLTKQQQGISRAVSHIGTYSTRWKTRFPLPT